MIGRILGIIFRFVRVAVGGAVYVVVALCFVGIYLVWIAIPPTLLFFSVWKI